MEDHLKNKDRLEQEWEALCAYQAEPNARNVGMKDGNGKKNRSTAVVACKQANPNCIWFVFIAVSVSFTSREMQTKSTKFGIISETDLNHFHIKVDAVSGINWPNLKKGCLLMKSAAESAAKNNRLAEKASFQASFLQAIITLLLSAAFRLYQSQRRIRVTFREMKLKKKCWKTMTICRLESFHCDLATKCVLTGQIGSK